MKLALIILVIGMICIAGVSYVAIDSEEEVEVFKTSMPDGIPTSPQDILNWDPSKTYGGVYNK